MAADSGSNYLATLLRRGASPFHAPSAPHARLAHAPGASSDHTSDAETLSATFTSTFELSLEETLAEHRHEAGLDRDASSRSRPDDRLARDNIRTESSLSTSPPVGNAAHDATPSRFNRHGSRDRAPEHISQQATETQASATGSFASHTATETAQQSPLTAQTSAPQETALKEISLTGTRAEQLGADSLARVERLEKSVARLDSVRLTNLSERNEARQSNLAIEPKVTPQPAEQTLTVARGENPNLQTEQAEAQAPPMNFTAQANAAFTSERAADLQRADNMAAPGKAGTLTIKRLEVQLINQTPSPSPAPQTNVRPPLPRTTRTNSLHRHHLGRFSWGL